MDDGAIVLDIGSSSVKAGWSGEDGPRNSFPAALPTSKPSAATAKGLRRMESVDGHVSSVSIGGVDVELGHAMERGEVIDWDRMSALLEHTFSTEMDLGGEAVATPVIIAESPLAKKEDREKMTELLFETFKVAGVCFANSAVLSLFASGRTRGLVLEVGSGKSHAVPVFEGFSLPHSILSLQAAGQDVTSYLQKNLQQKLPYHIVKEMKHSLANTLPVTGKEAIKKKTEYELPDGTTVSIDGVYTSACVDLLFDPDEYGVSNASGGLSSMVSASLLMCDADARADMAANVVVAGGSTMIPGFADRVGKELRSDPSLSGLDVHVVPEGGKREAGYNSQRRHAAWIGGSIVASLDTFSAVQVTKQDYEDSGANGEYKKLVHRKSIL